MLHKAWNSKGEMRYRFPRSSIKFQGHTVQNITDFDPNWAFPDYRPVAAFKSLRFALLKILCFCDIWLVSLLADYYIQFMLFLCSILYFDGFAQESRLRLLCWQCAGVKCCSLALSHQSMLFVVHVLRFLYFQGSFCLRAQPMRDVTI